jgi:hypothetical protein
MAWADMRLELLEACTQDAFTDVSLLLAPHPVRRAWMGIVATCQRLRDECNEASLAKLSADGFKPRAVVETSAGNFQAWLKHSIFFPKLIGTGRRGR